MTYFLKSYCFGISILGIPSVGKNLMKEVKFFFENGLFRSKGRSSSMQSRESCFYEKHTCFSDTVQTYQFVLTTDVKDTFL